VERDKKIELKKKGNSLGRHENYDNYMVNTFLNTVGKKYEVTSPIQAQIISKHGGGGMSSAKSNFKSETETPPNKS